MEKYLVKEIGGMGRYYCCKTFRAACARAKSLKNSAIVLNRRNNAVVKQYFK